MCTQGQQGRAAAAADEHSLLPQDSGEVSASDERLAGAYSHLSVVLGLAFTGTKAHVDL